MRIILLSTNMYEINLNKLMEFYQSFDVTFQSVNNDVKIIKHWIKSQPHLPEIMEEVKIRNFLNLNKFSIEKTKQTIDMYYTIRSMIPDFFENNNPKLPHMKQFMDNTYFCTHPKAVDGLHRVHFIKTKKPNVFTPKEMMITCYNIFELRSYEDCMVSDIFIIDLANATFSDVNKITPSLLAKSLLVYKEVYSLRLKAIHFVNSPSYISILMKMFKAVAKLKIFERIQVHEDDLVLKQIFSEDVLPKDYEGSGLSLDELNEMTIRKFAQYQERFDELDSLRVDETLRPQKLNNDELLGFYGNFKKLEVD